MLMDKLKRIIGILPVLCLTVAFTSCGENSPQEVTPNETTQTAENEISEEITVLSLNKEYISHYERMLSLINQGRNNILFLPKLSRKLP